MSDVVKIYNETGAPFTVNIYPFFSLYNDPNFPTDYAFFEGKAKPVVDGNVAYTNVFDANYDTLLAALRSEGCGNVPIILGEVGWPTDGDRRANRSIAERFYSGLTQKLANGSGTYGDSYELVSGGRSWRNGGFGCCVQQEDRTA